MSAACPIVRCICLLIAFVQFEIAAMLFISAAAVPGACRLHPVDVFCAPNFSHSRFHAHVELEASCTIASTSCSR